MCRLVRVYLSHRKGLFVAADLRELIVACKDAMSSSKFDFIVNNNCVCCEIHSICLCGFKVDNDAKEE